MALKRVTIIVETYLFRGRTKSMDDTEEYVNMRLDKENREQKKVTNFRNCVCIYLH